VVYGFHRITVDELLRRDVGQLLCDILKKRTAFILRVVSQFTDSKNPFPQYENGFATN
jgi:hypothetical protein